MKWPVSIETYLHFLDYHKFWTHPYTYFILTLLNSGPTSKFYKPTQLFVQVYITFLRFEIQATKDEQCAINDEHNKVSREEKEKFLRQISRDISYLAMKVYTK